MISLRDEKTRRGKAVEKMHLLVVVAERVRDAEFGNIHQSTLSIPGVAIKKKKKGKQLRKRWRRRSVPRSPHFSIKCWSGVGCCLPSLPVEHTHTHPHTHKVKTTPSASARQTPVCTGAVHLAQENVWREQDWW